MKERIFNLLSIKSLVTLGLVGVFLYLCVTGKEIPANLDTYVGLVIAFYFGTQFEKSFKEDKTFKEDEKQEEEDVNIK